jgi:serine protease Do
VEGAVRVKVVVTKDFSNDERLSSILKLMGDIYEAEIVGVDYGTDLAVLKIEGNKFPNLSLGNSNDINPGQMVFAFGSSMGLTNSVTMGLVSSVARQLSSKSPMICIQTDASINPGKSGGRL